MRVVWKEHRTYVSKKYRGYIVERSHGGWITNVPGDDNIYFAASDALNGIDKILGGHGRCKSAARYGKEIRVIGNKRVDTEKKMKIM